jgi:GTP-binding protein YchF
LLGGRAIARPQRSPREDGLLRVGLVGLPRAGKSTVFDALVRASGAQALAGRTYAGLTPRVATVKVPDPRLAVLAAMYRPRKVVPAEVEYHDVPRLAGAPPAEGGRAAHEARQTPAYLAQLRNMDALLHVVAGFGEAADAALPARMVARLEEGATELVLADLLVVEGRLARLESELRKLPAAERAMREREHAALEQVRARLDAGGVVRDLTLSPEDERLLRGFGLLTAKPTLIVANLDETTWPAREAVETALRAAHAHAATGVVALMAQWEAELAQLEPEEAAAFREALGLSEPAAERVLAEMYRVAGLISFLTVGEDEVRAWPVPRGTHAPEAAGAVHSDFQRAFIRAEVVAYEDLVRCGSWAAARTAGALRQVGKDYVMQDGDVTHFLAGR